MRYFLIIGVLLNGCTRTAERLAKVSNKEFQVEQLFEVDGCKVYRFNDGGAERYFTNCGQAFWREGCGKHCSREVAI